MMLLYIVITISFFVLADKFIHKIKNLPPSPFPALPIIGHLYLLKKPLHRTLAKLSYKHGPILHFQFGSRPVLIISSPSHAEECLSQNDIAFSNRPRLIAGKYIGQNYTSVAWANYGDHWRNLRRVSSLELLSTNRIQMLSSIRADEVRSLISRLLDTHHQPVDMKAMFFEATLNAIMRMIAGKIYYGKDVTDIEQGRKFREILQETFKIAGTTNIWDYLPMLNCIAGRRMEGKLRAVQKKRDEFMQDLIQEHRDLASSGATTKKTMIEVLLDLQKSQPEYYSDQVIRGLMLALLGAGSDTSAGTMEWGLSLLLNHPEVLTKAQSEIDSVVGNERLMDEADLAKLPYLHCIIKETLRMKAPAPLLPHESSEECTVGGYHIPRGTMLILNLWAIHNDPKVWKDAESYKPERFEGSEGMREGYKSIPFGSGRRSCPGESLAVRMVSLAFGSVIQCFEWERMSEELVDLKEGAGLTVPKAQPLFAKCKPRPCMINLLSQL